MAWGPVLLLGPEVWVLAALLRGERGLWAGGLRAGA